MNKRFKKIFPDSKTLIGMIHLPPMPGYSGHPGKEAVVSKALRELESLQTAKFDGVLVENDNDQPPPMAASSEYKKAFKYVMKEILREAKIPVGMEIVYDMISTVDIAKEVEAHFVRLDVFADDVETRWGKVEASAEIVKPGNVVVFADVQVKHARLVNPRPLEKSIRDTVRRGADAVVITGEWTGLQPHLPDLVMAKKECGDGVPVIVGSGLSIDNAESLYEFADGGIVGTSIKSLGSVDLEKAVKMRDVVKKFRNYNS